ncbi:MAG: hypothetical protein ACRD6I_20335, partial [Candidatus Acidiferrales bacterium]
MTGITAFREAFMNADVVEPDDYETWDARRLRYSLLWAYFQGNPYRDVHKWTRRMRTEYGLYKHVRSIYNPAYEIVTFHRAHVWGGALDPAAG